VGLGPAMATAERWREMPADIENGSDPVSDLLALLFRTPEVDLSWGIESRLLPGARLGRFLLARELGRGRSGTIYEALDLERERPVALKVLSPGQTGAPRDAAWAQREASDFRRLDHPNIVALQGVGTCPAGAYLVFELLRGRTLRLRLGDGPLELDGALHIAGHVAKALAHAHAVGVVHRGLTAAKVFVCDDGAVKVLDFSPGRRHPSHPENAASPEVSPEQQAGWPGDERSDLYALAVLLQEMLTATTGAGRAAHPNGVAVPRRLRRLLAAGLAPDPARRPQAAAEWLDELAAIRSGLGGRWPWRGLFAGAT
jgi:eukaryotic-like serine/threonine-protein kinase